MVIESVLWCVCARLQVASRVMRVWDEDGTLDPVAVDLAETVIKVPVLAWYHAVVSHFRVMWPALGSVQRPAVASTCFTPQVASPVAVHPSPNARMLAPCALLAALLLPSVGTPLLGAQPLLPPFIYNEIAY